MKILFMITEPRVLKYYFNTLQFMLKEGHSVHVAYFSLEKYRGGKRCMRNWPPNFRSGSATRGYPEDDRAYGGIY